MNRPPFSAYLLGNLPVTATLVIFGFATSLRWWAGELEIGFAIIGVLSMIAGIRSRQRLTAYRKWRRAWEAMGGAQPPKGTPITMQAIGCAVVIAVICIGSSVAQQSDTQTQARLILLAVAITPVLLCAMAIRRWRRRRRVATKHADDAVVTISVHQALIEAPPLSVAYQRLPPHCLRALQSTTACARPNAGTGR